MFGLLPIIPLVTYAVPAIQRVPIEEVSSPRVAQVRLAETLAEAESIESVHARGNHVTFVIVRDGEMLDLTAQTKKSGEIVSLSIARSRSALVQLHGLSWLGNELAEVTAVTRLVVDEDGAVVIATNDGRRYMAIPGRGSGGSPTAASQGNTAAEARWAAAWNSEDS